MNSVINITQIIPTLTDGTELIISQDGRYLIFNVERCIHLETTKSVFALISLIDGKINLGEIAAKLSSACEEEIGVEFVYDFLYKKMSIYGIVDSDTEMKPSRAKYLVLRIPLISSKTSRVITRYTKNLCRPKIFYTLLISSFIFLSITSLAYWPEIKGGLIMLDMKKSLLMIAVSVIGLFCHELGHVSACDFYESKHGSIGFGFYIFTPVVYADVSDIWRLPKERRLIVNLAGICFGNIYCVCVTVVYVLSGNVFFLYVSLIEFIQSLINFNPFIKYDGYWVLSDLIGVPNLHKVSYEKAIQAIRKYHSYNYKDWLLAFYGIISMSFIAAFIIFVLLVSPDSVLYFPRNAMEFVHNFVKHPECFSIDGVTQFIVPISFYWMLFIMVKRVILRYRRNPRRGNNAFNRIFCHRVLQ